MSSTADQTKKENGSAGGLGSATVPRNKQGPSKSAVEAVSAPSKIAVLKKRVLMISDLKKAENGESRLPAMLMLAGHYHFSSDNYVIAFGLLILRNESPSPRMPVRLIFLASSDFDRAYSRPFGFGPSYCEDPSIDYAVNRLPAAGHKEVSLFLHGSWQTVRLKAKARRIDRMSNSDPRSWCRPENGNRPRARNRIFFARNSPTSTSPSRAPGRASQTALVSCRLHSAQKQRPLRRSALQK